MSVYPSVSKSVFRSVHKSLNALLTGGGSTPFDPDSISGIQARILDGGTIWTDQISSKYYLKDQSTDNTHLPRQGRCWLFDGVNDYGQAASLTNALTGVVTLSFWLKPTTVAAIGTFGGTLVGDGNAGGTNAGLSVNLNRTFGGANAAKLGLYAGGSDLTQNNTALTANQWVHVCITRSGSTGSWNYTYYINGVADGTFSSAVDPGVTGVAFTVGRFGDLANLYSPHNYRDIRIYSSAKDSTAVAAIYNQSLTGNGVFDSTNLVAYYTCNEESGTTGYDISGNGNHLTLTNITQATFHATDTGVLTNRNNDEGYRLSGSVYIPKRLSSSLAADGNALTVTGRAAYHGCAEVPCVTGDGSTVYADLGSPIMPATGDYELSFWFYHTSAADERPFGQDSFIFYVNSQIVRARVFGTYNIVSGAILSNDTWNKITLNRTGDLHTMTVLTPTASYSYTYTGSGSNSVSANSLLLRGLGTTTAGRISDLRITTGGVTTYFPLQDGPGSSNTNRNLAYVKSDGTGGVISNAIVNGTVSTIWGNRVPGHVKDWCIDNGGRIGAAGEYIAGLIGSANAADGNAKTLTAGKHGNPFSRLNLNPATAAEFNGRSIPTASAVANDINAAVTPAESAFRRTDTDGDDRFLIYESALSGSDLTNVETYVT